MCEITTALVIAGSALSAYGQIRAGQQQANYAQAQAAALQQQAANERRRALAEELRFRTDATRERSNQRAQLAKAGVRLDEGTPLLLQEEAAEAAELDALAIRVGGENAARAAETEAGLTLERGKDARTAGLIGAGTEILTGGATLGRLGLLGGEAKRQPKDPSVG